MKANETKKLYKVSKTADGRTTVQMNEKGTDGRYHSFVVPADCMVRTADGKMRKITRKEIIRDALKEMLPYYPVLADGNKK